MREWKAEGLALLGWGSGLTISERSCVRDKWRHWSDMITELGFIELLLLHCCSILVKILGLWVLCVGWRGSCQRSAPNYWGMSGEKLCDGCAGNNRCCHSLSVTTCQKSQMTFPATGSYFNNIILKIRRWVFLCRQSLCGELGCLNPHL